MLLSQKGLITLSFEYLYKVYLEGNLEKIIKYTDISSMVAFNKCKKISYLTITEFN